MTHISPIADAKNKLTQLIYAVEHGDDIQLTRHGKPVAVLISAERYNQLTQPKPNWWQAVQTWREQSGGLEMSVEEIDGWRDRSPAREFAWD